MTGIRAWPTWKKAISIALCVLVAMDLVLIVLVWRNSVRGPEEMRLERDRLAIEARLLRADVTRGEGIRASLPQVGKDCDAFYDQSFLPASTGYSEIDNDLSAIASKAGVRTTGYAFTEKEVNGRGVTEVTMSTSVEADYPAIIRFVNGLEVAKHFYLVDELHLSSASAGTIRLDIQLHTYFRT
jgi:Type II secretion system (T2SS), protein M subtype b